MSQDPLQVILHLDAKNTNIQVHECLVLKEYVAFVVLYRHFWEVCLFFCCVGHSWCLGGFSLLFCSFLRFGIYVLFWGIHHQATCDCLRPFHFPISSTLPRQAACRQPFFWALWIQSVFSAYDFPAPQMSSTFTASGFPLPPVSMVKLMWSPSWRLVLSKSLWGSLWADPQVHEEINLSQ